MREEGFQGQVGGVSGSCSSLQPFPHWLLTLLPMRAGGFLTSRTLSKVTASPPPGASWLPEIGLQRPQEVPLSGTQDPSCLISKAQHPHSGWALAPFPYSLSAPGAIASTRASPGHHSVTLHAEGIIAGGRGGLSGQQATLGLQTFILRVMKSIEVF